MRTEPISVHPGLGVEPDRRRRQDTGPAPKGERRGKPAHPPGAAAGPECRAQRLVAPELLVVASEFGAAAEKKPG